jgi:hypothetical protein
LGGPCTVVIVGAGAITVMVRVATALPTVPSLTDTLTVRGAVLALIALAR